MNLVKIILSIFLFLLALVANAQTGVISGKVMNLSDNKPVVFADVVLENTNYFTVTDENGLFKIEGIKPGVYNILVRLIGYNDERLTEISIGTIRAMNLEIFMTENAAQLDEVVVKSSVFKVKSESPLSVNRIGVTEIMRSPGANRDISFVVRNLPGVATTTSFRNDIIVRGGSPGENRFFMDGIEIPNINHFATQGSSGGPVGMINVNFIQNVDFYTGSFPVSRGNALSSVMDITTKKANLDNLTGNITIGSSDFGLTLDTPTGKNSGMLFSVRRSYLQFLFQQLKLPFLPTYNDFQYSHYFKLNEKNQIKILGLGAIDNFKLNEKVNDGVTDPDILDRNNYILNNIPKNEQWNYAVGINWRRNTEKGYQEFVLSRNMLNNTAEKYLYNIETFDNLNIDYNSQEIENKFRFTQYNSAEKWKYYFGFGIERSKYFNDTYQKTNIGDIVQVIDFESELFIQKYSLFAQTNSNFWNDKLEVSLGIRTDFSDYSAEMSQPLKQLSPRVSLNYNLSEQSRIVGSVGKYFQLPAYTILGYRLNDGSLTNRENKVTYINVWHFATGYQYTPKEFIQLKFETFYKKYNHYPFDINQGISLANLGSDFGVIGNSPVRSTSEGRSYGFELSGIQKLTNRFFGSFSYTYVRSEFEDIQGKYVPSTWDTKHILNVVGGYKLNKNWELGMKFRLLGGAPYTPIDAEISSLQNVWDIRQQGVLDFSQLNQKRLDVFHALDFRIDKRWYFENWSLDFYLDIQNAYNYKIQSPSYFSVLYDANNQPIPSETNPQSYQYKFIENDTGTVLPSIGIMIDF